MRYQVFPLLRILLVDPKSLIYNRKVFAMNVACKSGIVFLFIASEMYHAQRSGRRISNDMVRTAESLTLATRYANNSSGMQNEHSSAMAYGKPDHENHVPALLSSRAPAVITSATVGWSCKAGMKLTVRPGK